MSNSNSPYLIPIDPDYADLSGLISIKIGELLDNNRYKVLGPSGQGTFGTVLKCYDYKHKRDVAIKAVRCINKYIDAAYIEADILSKIRDADPKKNSKCVQIQRLFEQDHNKNKHLFIVFEKLGGSLFEFIKNNHYRGFSMENVRSFAKQILQGVEFCHKLKLIHTDLKPENILLANSEYKKITLPSGKSYKEPLHNEIRIIDFGGSTFQDDHHAKIVNTRQYRAPEVILGLEWSYPSDIWSVGCILAELYTGELLFPTHNDGEHLAMMDKITGKKLPSHMHHAALKPYIDRILKKRKSDSTRSNGGSRRNSRERERDRSRERNRIRSRSRSYHHRDVYDGRARSRRSYDRRRSRSGCHSRSYDSRGRRFRYSRDYDNPRNSSKNVSRNSSPHEKKDNDPIYTPSNSRSRTPKDKKRSSSNPRADKLLHFRSCSLRWHENASSESKSLVSSLRNLNQMFEPHPEFIDLIMKMLTYDPNERITASEALTHPFFESIRDSKN